MLVHIIYIFSSVWVAMWPHFGEGAAHSIDHMFSLYFDYLLFIIVRFGFEGGVGVLIAPVPDHCLLVSFKVRFRVTVVRLQE